RPGVERRDDLGGNRLEAARLGEPASGRIVVDLDRQAPNAQRISMAFRLFVQRRSDTPASPVGPNPDPEPADRAGLVPLDVGRREAQRLAPLDGEPGAAPRALSLRA